MYVLVRFLSFVAISLLSSHCAEKERDNFRTTNKGDDSRTTLGQKGEQKEFKIYNGDSLPSDHQISRSTVIVKKEGSSLCSGTLIASQWVLSAAHCLTADTVVFPNNETRSVVRKVAHPLYVDDKVNPSADYDVALFRFSGEFPTSAEILSLYSPDLALGTPIFLAGYGRSSSQIDDFGNLAFAYNQIGAVRPLHFETTDTFVNSSFGSACSGDSGGPALAYFGNKLIQLGVQSLTLETTSSGEKCDYKAVYSNFNRVKLEWIRRQIPNVSVIENPIENFKHGNGRVFIIDDRNMLIEKLVTYSGGLPFLTGGIDKSSYNSSYIRMARVKSQVSTARFLFDQTPGLVNTYKLFASWPVLSTNSDKVEYKLGKKSFFVNQRVAPTGETFNGVEFQYVGEVETDSTTVEVKDIGERAGDQLVIDAIALKIIPTIISGNVLMDSTAHVPSHQTSGGTDSVACAGDPDCPMNPVVFGSLLIDAGTENFVWPKDIRVGRKLNQ